MKPKLLLTLAAIFWAFVGILLQADIIMFFGLDPNAPASLIASLRVPGSLLIALAVINWFARNSDASKARDAIFLGNTVGFVLVAIFDFLILLIPGADPTGWVFIAIQLFFIVAFIMVGRTNMSTGTS
jgi:hypothetical protein